MFKILRCLGGPIPQLGLGLSTGGSLYRLYLHFLSISPKVFDIGSWESFASLESGIFQWLPQFPMSLCYMFLFNFLILCTFLVFLQIPALAPHFHLPPLSLLCSSIPLAPFIILFSILCSIEAPTHWSFFFLSCIWYVGCITGILNFGATSYLLVHTLWVFMCMSYLGMIFSRSTHLPEIFMKSLF